MAKNLPASEGDAGDTGFISRLERSMEEEMTTHSSVLVWEIPWTRGTCRATVHRVAKSGMCLSTNKY